MSATILDGAMGTELEARGVKIPSPGWSAWAIAHAPAVIAAIHADYAAAGATVHTANTFRTTRRAVGDGWAEWARRAVAIARRSVPAGHRVAGSIAPVEDCYRPDLSPREAARDEHAELARALVDAGVDLLLCETFPDPVEARVAVEEASATGVETWAALTAGPEGDLMTPRALARAAEACARAGARVVLVNCVAASLIEPFVASLASIGAPFGAYANAGRPDEGLGWGAAGDEGPRRYREIVRRWIDLGASVVGGCCGTGPRHIAAIVNPV